MTVMTQWNHCHLELKTWQTIWKSHHGLVVVLCYNYNAFQWILSSSHSVDKFTAEDIHGQAGAMSPTTGLPKSCNSFFNKALREALTIKGEYILNVFNLVLRSKKVTSKKNSLNN